MGSSVGVRATDFSAASTVAAEDRLDVGVVLGDGDGGLGRLADDGQDRALDRLADRRVGALRPWRRA